jgi:pimeloyl-ACP methyl ester carboxylesterase
VLFTWAMHDRINPFKASEATIAEMKQACVVKFNGGHAAFLEQPRQFFRGVRTVHRQKLRRRAARRRSQSPNCDRRAR